MASIWDSVKSAVGGTPTKSASQRAEEVQAAKDAAERAAAAKAARDAVERAAAQKAVADITFKRGGLVRKPAAKKPVAKKAPVRGRK